MTLDYKKPPIETTNRMRKVKSKETGLEKKMEFILNELNIDYEKQPSLIGKPDFRIKDSNILIFCDSSFWHGRRESDVKGKSFKRNKEFWIAKLNYNKKRDARNNRLLRKDGWSVYRFWDTDIFKNQEKVMRRLKRIINENKQKETHRN